MKRVKGELNKISEDGKVTAAKLSKEMLMIVE